MDGVQFWRNVDVGSDEECWEWRRCRNGKGYGMLRSEIMGEWMQRAHRVAWRLTFGAIPNGKQVLHKCDNPPCCNPYHLYVGTNADNVRDKQERRPQVGERAAKHKLTEAQVRAMREEYIEKQTSCEKLSDRYPINASSVWLVLTYRSWPHVAPELRDKIVMRPKVRRGANAPRSKLTEKQVMEARQRHANGEPVGQLRREYGVSWTSMRRAIDGRSWGHLPLVSIKEIQQ